MGVLYILDEPSIGLHQRDNDKLLGTLKQLRDLGNTLIVVEHDEDTMRAADFIVDVGPGAGSRGGEIVAAGSLEEIIACERSVTGQYLSGFKKIPVPAARRSGNGKSLRVQGAAENNLKNVDVEIPLGTLTCVTGVSGSGKSSLVNEVLNKTLLGKLNHARTRPGVCRCVEGMEYLDKVIDIDRAPSAEPPEAIRLPTQACSTISGTCLLPPTMRRSGVTDPAASASMSRAAAVRPAPVTAW